MKRHMNTEPEKMKQREIKFRFYGIFEDEDEKRMIYSEDFAFSGYTPINDLFARLGAEIMQYTGLKDKNGKEIYEGDIVKYPPDYRNVSYQIFWQDAGWLASCYRGTKHIEPDLCEVIGNIYENQELLKSHEPK